MTLWPQRKLGNACVTGGEGEGEVRTELVVWLQCTSHVAPVCSCVAGYRYIIYQEEDGEVHD